MSGQTQAAYDADTARLRAVVHGMEREVDRLGKSIYGVPADVSERLANARAALERREGARP